MPFIESLEPRALLSAVHPSQVKTAYLDNRGRATLTFTVPLVKSTLTKASAGIYTAGPDQILGNNDDHLVSTQIRYAGSTLTLTSHVHLNQPYRVILKSKTIKDAKGRSLDGEFRGAGVKSGNGRVGGNYDVATAAPQKTVYQFTTNQGLINVRLFTNPLTGDTFTATPNTVTNFKHYADEGTWDTTFFHRSTRDTATGGIQVIQGGGFNISSQNQIGSVHSHTGVGLELGNSNLTGTIAMARTSDVNSNTNQWFFNVNDNTALDTFGGGYTVFGKVTDAASQATIVKINALKIRQGDPTNPDSPFNELPSLAKTGTIDVPQDLVTVTRVAMLMDLVRG